MPNITLQNGASLSNMSSSRLQDGATLKTISSGWFQDGATLRKVWPPVVYVPMTVSVGNVSGSYTASSGTHAIGNVYCTVSNGDSPYSYSWSVSGSYLSVVSHGSYATVYSSRNTAGSGSGTVTCTVTDATSHTKSDSGSVSYTVNSSYVPMTGSISPSSLSGTTTQSSGNWYTLGTATISVSNGDPGYTYAWSISGTGLRITGGTTGSSVTVQVDRSTVATRTGTLQCVVTDSTSHTMTKSISVSGTVNSSYTNITVTSQPADATTGPYSPAPRPGNEPFSMSRSMTTSGGTVGSIAYSIANLSGDTDRISVSVSGDGTHTASISGSGTRNRFDDATYSVTFRVKATDGTSTVYSRYVTFTDLQSF